MTSWWRPTKLLDVAINVCMVLAAILVAVMALSVTYSVIAREFFSGAPALLFEFSEYSLLLITFLALAYVGRADGHIRMELLEEFLPARAMRVVNLFGDAIVSLLALGLLLGTLLMTIRDFESGAVTDGIVPIDRWLLMAVLPVGTLLFLLQQLRTAWRRLRGTGGEADGEAAAVGGRGV